MNRIWTLDNSAEFRSRSKEYERWHPPKTKYVLSPPSTQGSGCAPRQVLRTCIQTASWMGKLHEKREFRRPGCELRQAMKISSRARYFCYGRRRVPPEQKYYDIKIQIYLKIVLKS
ncbi:hypothetical protein ElyMa_006818300 [Elysia marginata]|uniref:Uncharacterized protein n=1 Tax=Elysia marginata TaxID=1093978 RepID=A0AAV4J9J5_9GAST|nr:hypothetical protein ElyMa_006818300 [Elysia marginata]